MSDNVEKIIRIGMEKIFVIPKEESERVEFKESLAKISEILKTICAFANKEGGEIYIGISDDGRIVGVRVGKRTLEKLAEEITKEIRPGISVKIEKVVAGGKELLKIIVPEGDLKPYFYKGVAYKRVGKSNLRMDPQEVELLIIKRYTSKITFDSEPTDVGLEEIDEGKLRSFVERLGRKWKGKVDALKNLGLMRKNNLLKAAVLLFGKNPSVFFPQNYFKCVKVDEFGEILEFENFGGDLFEIVENVYNFALKNMPKRVRIEGLKREIEYFVPKSAIREAIVNAVVHRDYRVMSFSYLRIEPDRIVVKNPGVLPEGLDVRDLYREHSSIPRNPLIANIFFLAGYIEAWGSGTLRMIRDCIRSGLSLPKFEEKGGFFYVIFDLKEKVLGEREKKILDYLSKKGTVKTSEVAEFLGVSSRTALRILNKLADLGYIIRAGSKKGRIYRILV